MTSIRLASAISSGRTSRPAGTREGQPLRKRRYLFSETFATIALAAYGTRQVPMPSSSCSMIRRWRSTESLRRNGPDYPLLFGIPSMVEAIEQGRDEEKVAAVPGIAFGADDYIRISYATGMANIEKGMDRIDRFVRSLAKA